MNVLDYESYEEYLDNFISLNDLRYLRNLNVSRAFIQNACGKICMGRLLTRNEFNDQRKKLDNIMHPRGISASTLFGQGYNGNDDVLQQFAKRELKLLNKQLSTIIFLLMRSKKGLEVSGFIDLGQSFCESRFKTSLHYDNWPAIFEGKARLMPQSHHLSFFDWNKNRILMNDSDNFQVLSKEAHSLLMMHRGDHKIVCVNANCRCNHTRHVQCSIYNSSIYGQCIFFDHVVRRFN